jgi:hypothetical protein
MYINRIQWCEYWYELCYGFLLFFVWELQWCEYEINNWCENVFLSKSFELVEI